MGERKNGWFDDYDDDVVTHLCTGSELSKVMTQSQKWNRIIHSIHTFFSRNQTDHASSFVNEQKDESMTPYAEKGPMFKFESKMNLYLFSRIRVAMEVQTIISKSLWLAFHF